MNSDSKNETTFDPEGALLVDWPLHPDTAKSQLLQARAELERHKAALSLAKRETQSSTRVIKTLAVFTHQASQISSTDDLFRLTLKLALETVNAEIE